MDAVNHPEHYQGLSNIETKEVIEAVLNSQEGDLSNWEAYCLGNHLKYRMRAGEKDALAVDIGKSNVYKEWFNRSRKGGQS
jgi:hypothetical protein